MTVNERAQGKMRMKSPVCHVELEFPLCCVFLAGGGAAESLWAFTQGNLARRRRKHKVMTHAAEK